MVRLPHGRREVPGLCWRAWEAQYVVFPRRIGVLLFLLISLLTVVAAPRDAEDMVEWLRQMIEGEHRRRQHAREQEVMRGQESKDDSHSVKKRLRS